MTSENPFSDQHASQYANSQGPMPSRGGGQVLKVLAIIAVIVCLFCAGMGGLLYWGVQLVAYPDADVTLPPGNDFDSDQKLFNQSLAALSDDPHFDPEVCKLVDRTVIAINAGKNLEFSAAVFMEAVAASRISGGSLGVAERLALQRSLRLVEPVPTTSVEYYRVLNVRIEPSDKLGRVDLLVYSDELQAESHQWYLVKEDGRWKFYDWQSLELGRRKSDEYAAFVRGPDHLSPGFDNLIAKLGDAQAKWSAGDEQAAKRILKACENILMLSEDRDESLLRIAWQWMSFDDYDESLRVAQRIRFPNQMWGAWTAIGVCHFALGNHDEALAAAEQAREQSPDHPNVLWLLSAIYGNLDRQEEAADAALRALVICREDREFMQNVVDFGRAADVPKLLDIVTRNESDERWLMLLDQAGYSAEWAAAFAREVSQRENLPPGVLEFAQGSLEWAQGNHDVAAVAFLNARKLAVSEELKQRATYQYLTARIEENRFEELFSEAEDPESIAATLVEWAYDDAMYCDESKLLDALQKQDALALGPWAAGLRAWAHYNRNEFDEALHDYDTLLTWLKENAQSLEEDRQWILDTTEFYLADTLLTLDRPLDVVTRWPEDADRHDQVGSHLLDHYDQPSVAKFLEQTSDTDSTSLRLQRSRLEASVAMRAGDAEQCDLRHREAIDFGRIVYGKDRPYARDVLIRERAKNLVWNRVDVDAVEASGASEEAQAEHRTLLSGAVSEAARLCDVELVERWMRRADSDGVRAGDEYAEMQSELGDFRMLTGDHRGAIDALRNCLAATEVESRWFYHRRRDQLLTALLAAGEWTEAKALFDGDANLLSSGPSAAIVELAAGDEAAFQTALAECDKADLANLFEDVLVKRHLTLHSDQPWLVELLRQNPNRVGYLTPYDRGELLLERETTIDPQVLRTVLDQTLGESFAVAEVAEFEPNSEVQSWLATSASGQRWLLNRSVRRYETRGVPQSLAEALSEPTVRLTIAVLDDQPNATRRLFRVAAGFAELPALLFSWGDDSLTWSERDLARQLQWRDRVPVSRQVFPISLLLRENADRASEEYLTLDEWKRRLAEAGGPLSVYLAVTTHQCREAIPSELLSVSVDEYELVVRPKIDSKLDPIIKAGISYRTGSSSVRPTPPE